MAKRRRPPEEPDVEVVEPDQVPPLDVDGVRTVAVVTILWAVAFVLLALRMDALQAEDRGWWIWTCLAGVGLGLLGLEYARKRRDAIEAEREETAQADAARATDDAPGATEHAARAESGVVGGEVLTRGEVLARDADRPGRTATTPDSVTRPVYTGNLPSVRPRPHPRGAETSHGRPAWSGGPATPAAPPVLPSAPPRPSFQRPSAASELLGEPVARPAASSSDDEPLLDTTFDSRRTTADEPTGHDTERGGQYRGRRARRSDTA